MEEISKKAIIESILFSTPDPISVKKINEIVEDSNIEMVMDILRELKNEYESDPNRGFMLEEVAGGYRLVSKPLFADYIKKALPFRKRTGLSRQSLETLSIILYKQPITKAEIEHLRGVSNVDGVLHTLLEKKLIKVAGKDNTKPGRPSLYQTTDELLKYFGIKDLTELPPVEELVDKERTLFFEGDENATLLSRAEEIDKNEGSNGEG